MKSVVQKTREGKQQYLFTFDVRVNLIRIYEPQGDFKRVSIHVCDFDH